MCAKACQNNKHFLDVGFWIFDFLNQGANILRLGPEASPGSASLNAPATAADTTRRVI